MHGLIEKLARDEGAGVVLEAVVVHAGVHELLVELALDVQAIVMLEVVLVDQSDLSMLLEGSCSCEATETCAQNNDLGTFRFHYLPLRLEREFTVDN